MYFQSDGVPMNATLAMMWVELALAGGTGRGLPVARGHHAGDDEAEREGGVAAVCALARNPSQVMLQRSVCLRRNVCQAGIAGFL